MAKDCLRCPCKETTVKDITQIASGGLRHHYSTRRAFDCNSERLLMFQGSSSAIYDLQGNKLTNDLPLSSEAHWSVNDPNKIWTLGFTNGSLSTFGEWDVNAQVYNPLFDANAHFNTTGCVLNFGGFHENVENDECVVLRSECGNNVNYVSLSIANGVATVQGVIPETNNGDFAQFSPDCQYIFVKEDNVDFVFYDAQFNEIYRDTLPGGNIITSHMDWVMTADGPTMVVVWSGQNGYISPKGDYGFLNGAPSVTSASHISGRASMNCPGIALLTDYNDFNTSLNQKSYLIRVIPDGNNGYTSELLTDLGNLGASDDSYEENAKGSISPCGDYAIFNGAGPTTNIIEFDHSACPLIDNGGGGGGGQPMALSCNQSTWT